MKLLKFSSTWCAPCKVVSPIVESIKDQIDVTTYDVDECDENLLRKYGIRNIPVLIFESDKGEILWRHVGVITKSDLENKINEFKNYES